MVGPRTCSPPATTALMTRNWSTTTHTQDREVNSDQPSRSSASGRAGPSAADRVFATRSPAKLSPARRKTAALTAMPQPGPAKPTTIPPVEAPRTMPALTAIRTSAFAGRIMPAGTVCGTRAAAAGSETADTMPLMTLMTTSTGMEAKPSSTLAAITAWASPAATLDPWSTSRRGSRSAITPPNSSSATLATDRAPTTIPRSISEPVRSSTANESTIGAMALAKYVAMRPPARQRKFRCRSGSRSVGARVPSTLTAGPSDSPRSARCWRQRPGAC